MKKLLPGLLLIGLFYCTSNNGLMAQSVRINHVAFYVVNLETSAHFYRDIIGLDTIPEPFHDGRHAWFSIGPKAHLHIISGAQEKKSHEKNVHLCFSVSSVPGFIETLRQHHVEFENLAGVKNQFTTRVDGVKQIYFRDPDGYWIEINDAKE